MSESDYTVGYKRPPRHTRFKPGQSGNPKGRPRKPKSLAAYLKETLFRPVTVKVNGKLDGSKYRAMTLTGWDGECRQGSLSRFFGGA